jgi:acetyl esterase
MPLHPTIAGFLASLPAPDHGVPDPALLRAQEESQVPPLADRVPALDRVEDTELAGVPVRVYDGPDADTRGVIVYLHGGAFFLGSLDTHDHVARMLAKETGLRVISVGYRRAPEHPFPAGLDDATAVVKAVIDDGGDGRVLAVAGDSSGGNFVAVVAARLHDEGVVGVTHQVMYYPLLDLDFDTARFPSLSENAVGYGLEYDGLAPWNTFYEASGADPADPEASPFKRADLAGLPPALILTGEYDVLRDEGEQYGARLQASGVPTTVTRYPGAGHGFVQHWWRLPEYHRAFTETAEFLRSHA